MEFKMYKEIRNYYERFFMGLSLRQLICGGIGLAVALVLGFGLRGRVSGETLSWIIPSAVVPFFMIGFKDVKGMPMEKFIIAWFKQRFLMPKKLILRNDDIYSKLFKEMDSDAKAKQGKN